MAPMMTATPITKPQSDAPRMFCLLGSNAENRINRSQSARAASALRNVRSPGTYLCSRNVHAAAATGLLSLFEPPFEDPSATRTKCWGEGFLTPGPNQS